MTRTFVETEVFTRQWSAMGLDDDDLQELESILLENPGAGDTISETGGAKKIRVALEGRGKRGGGRVVYIDVVVRETIFLLTAYAKNVQVDLTKEQKKAVRKVVKTIIGEE